MIDERKNVQTPPPAPIASAIGPCPTIIQISSTPRHWKFTQHPRTTRPPPVMAVSESLWWKTSLEGSFISFSRSGGWSGGAKVLGKLPVPGRPTNLAYSRARAYCAFSRCGWGLFGHFFFHLSLLFSFSLSLGDGSI